MYPIDAIKVCSYPALSLCLPACFASLCFVDLESDTFLRPECKSSTPAPHRPTRASFVIPFRLPAPRDSSAYGAACPVS